MTERAKSLTRTALLCLCGGIGFNIAQRLVDHFLDIAVEHETWLAWLK